MERRNGQASSGDLSIKEKFEAVRAFYEPSYKVLFKKDLSSSQIESLYESMERLKRQWAHYVSNLDDKKRALLESYQLKLRLAREAQDRKFCDL